ncbi:MAG TPA: hypothetical protein VM575_11155 [Nocardioides sp.]|nr:hypothetical protein [Nocardioides sp.]
MSVLFGRYRGMLVSVTAPEWWRGQTPTERPRGHPRQSILTGVVDSVPLGDLDQYGSHPLYFFDAAVSAIDLWLNDVSLAVEWSEFENCHSRQRVKPVTNGHGFSAQGSFGNSPAFYRNCVFEGLRFKQLGGFNLSQAWFENCQFINCRWDGHFARNASLVDCTFSGRMNGCAWFGRSDKGPNIIRGNDFTDVVFTDNVAWRDSFPTGDQRWPPGFKPSSDG